MRKIMTTALVIATIAMGAQNKQRKACIKMEKDENGVVTRIDTCVTAATDEELQQKLNALGFGDMPEIPPVPGVPPIPPVPPLPPVPPGEEGKEVTMTKVIVIDGGEDSGNERKNAKTRKEKKKEAYSYSYSSSDGKDKEVEVVVIDGDGHIMKTKTGDGKGNNNVVIKKLQPGDKMDPEIEKIMKESGVDMKDGEAHKIIIKNNENKNGTESKDVKVFVFRKIEVKDLSAEDKKHLPENANKTIEKAAPIANLNIAPNPTDDACTISYKAASKEPLEINVYNMESKTVYTETDKNVSEQVNKTISLKELGKGIYYVHLTQGKQSEVRKVIVK
ncbi:MAG: T9SS type A sorting domain-containing protein [Bacteroidia bacterium]